jgi:hypothetical protein
VTTEERLAWLFADVTGTLATSSGPISAEDLDPSDEDHRHLLIEIEHPEFHAALRDPSVDEVEVAGRPVNPRLHIALHEIVANQILGDEAPEVWETAMRLAALGYSRHDVLHMLVSVVGEDVRLAMVEDTPYDRERHLAALAALPGSWEAMRRRGRSRGARAPGGRRRRKGRQR